MKERGDVEVLESDLTDGRWTLKIRVHDDRLWKIIKGEYRPWWLRVVNFFRWLFRLPPIHGRRVGAFSIGGKVEGRAR